MIKVGDKVYIGYPGILDIIEVQIIKETGSYFMFNDGDKTIRRGKKKFSRSKEEALEKTIYFINSNLSLLGIGVDEIYDMYKEVLEKYPEIMI